MEKYGVVLGHWGGGWTENDFGVHCYVDVSVGAGGLADAPGSALANCRFLRRNQLSGTIPTELGKLANLEIL